MFDFTGRDNDLNPGKDFDLLCPDGTRAGKIKKQSSSVSRTCSIWDLYTENSSGNVDG